MTWQEDLQPENNYVSDSESQPFSFNNLFHIPIKEENIYEFDINMGDNTEEILKILQEDDIDNNKYYNFIAKMNSGKTYTMIDICNKYGIKAIIAVPLQPIAQQKYEEYKKRNELDHQELMDEFGSDFPNPYPCNVRAVLGSYNSPNGEVPSVLSEDIENMIINEKIHVFISVYDSISKFRTVQKKKDNYGKPIFDPSEYVLIVDEAHNLATQYGFRSSAIQSLLHYQKEFKKVIYLSGTPEGTLLKYHKTFLFKKRNNANSGDDENLIPKIKIVRYDDNGYYKLYNQLLNDRNIDGVKVILHDNKDSIERFQHALHIDPLFNIPVEQIATFYSKNKSEEYLKNYWTVVKEEIIPPETKYVFTTRKLADGVNIKTKVSRIYILDVSDYWLKRQFIGRFRNQQPEVYDFIKTGEWRYFHFKDQDKYLIENFIDSRDLIQEAISSFSKLTATERKIFKNISGFLKNQIRYKYLCNPSKYIKPLVSIHSILADYIAETNYEIHTNAWRDSNNKSFPQKYYEELCGYRTEIIYNTDETTLTEHEFLEYWYRFGATSIAIHLEKHEKTFNELFKYYCLVHKKNNHAEYYNSGFFDSSLMHCKFYIENSEEDLKILLNDEDSIKIMDMAVELAKEGFPKIVIFALLVMKAKLDPRIFNKQLRILIWRINLATIKKFKKDILSISHPTFLKEYHLIDEFNTLSGKIFTREGKKMKKWDDKRLKELEKEKKSGQNPKRIRELETKRKKVLDSEHIKLLYQLVTNYETDSKRVKNTFYEILYALYEIEKKPDYDGNNQPVNIFLIEHLNKEDTLQFRNSLNSLREMHNMIVNNDIAMSIEYSIILALHNETFKFVRLQNIILHILKNGNISYDERIKLEKLLNKVKRKNALLTAKNCRELP